MADEIGLRRSGSRTLEPVTDLNPLPTELSEETTANLTDVMASILDELKTLRRSLVLSGIAFDLDAG